MNDLLVLSGEPLVGGPRFPEAHHLTAAPQPDRLLEDLNPSQREAVMATSGPLAIIAGAGSGKTRVISRRAAYAIETGAAASDQILLVTFTEKAAGEMVERMVALGHRGVMARTFHAAALAQLRHFWPSGHDRMGQGPPHQAGALARGRRRPRPNSSGALRRRLPKLRAGQARGRPAGLRGHARPDRRTPRDGSGGRRSRPVPQVLVQRGRVPGHQPAL